MEIMAHFYGLDYGTAYDSKKREQAALRCPSQALQLGPRVPWLQHLERLGADHPAQ